MTIEVRIENKDAKRSLRIVTVEYDREWHRERDIQQQEIQPGQAATFHIHMLRDLRVTESTP